MPSLFRIALLWLAATLCAPAGAATIFDNLSLGGSGNVWVGGQYQRGNRITLGNSAAEITEVVLNLAGSNNTNGPLTVNVCGDQPGGAGPAADCALFMASSGGNTGLAHFTGSYSAPAYAAVWVIFSYPAGNSTTGYGVYANTVSPFYGRASSDSGATWSAPPASFLMQLNGTISVLPTVIQNAPQQGPSLGGTQVTITGTNLTGATAVRFGGVDASPFTVNSATQITATAPAHAPGTVAIEVTTSNGTASGGSFSYIAPAAITAILPALGPTTGGGSVAILGSAFTGATGVSFGGVAASSFTVDSDSQITATVPAHGAGSVTAQVTTPGGTSTGGSYTYAAAPTITAVTPMVGLPAGGNNVTITGTGFTGTYGIAFGWTPASRFTVDSDSQITVAAPSQPPGPVNLQISAPGGSVTGGIYVYATPPAIASVTPSTGPASGGTRVTINGTGFTGTYGIAFGWTPASQFTVDSDSQITVTAPSQPPGRVSLSVSAPGGTVSGGGFTYVAAPALTSITPATGSTTGGTSVTIQGSALTGATAVTLGGTPATSFTVDSDTQITATAPAHGVGPVGVQVATAGGSATLASAFTYADPPVNGTCGGGAGQASIIPPSGAALCGTGTPGAVASANGQYEWRCAGERGGADSNLCTAPWAAAGIASRATVALPDAASNHGWTLGAAGFDPALPAPLPAGATTSLTPLRLVLQAGTAGSSATITVQYTEPVPANAVYMKYGRSPQGYSCSGTSCDQDHWYTLPANAAVFSPDRRSVTLTLTDGGLGDGDTTPGQITDPGLPVLMAPAPAAVQSVPALSPWGLAAISALLASVAGLARRPRAAARR